MSRLRWGWPAWPETAPHPLLGQLGLRTVPCRGGLPWGAACRAGRRGSPPQLTLACHQEGHSPGLQVIAQLSWQVA